MPYPLYSGFGGHHGAHHIDWSKIEPEVTASSEAAVKLCPVDGHLKRLKVEAFISSVEGPISPETVGRHPHYVVRDIGTVEELRDFHREAGHPKLVGPASLLEAIGNAGLSISTTISQGSFDW